MGSGTGFARFRSSAEDGPHPRIKFADVRVNARAQLDTRGKERKRAPACTGVPESRGGDPRVSEHDVAVEGVRRPTNEVRSTAFRKQQTPSAVRLRARAPPVLPDTLAELGGEPRVAANAPLRVDPFPHRRQAKAASDVLAVAEARVDVVVVGSRRTAGSCPRRLVDDSAARGRRRARSSTTKEAPRRRGDRGRGPSPPRRRKTTRRCQGDAAATRRVPKKCARAAKALAKAAKDNRGGEEGVARSSPQALALARRRRRVRGRPKRRRRGRARGARLRRKHAKAVVQRRERARWLRERVSTRSKTPEMPPPAAPDVLATAEFVAARWPADRPATTTPKTSDRVAPKVPMSEAR